MLLIFAGCIIGWLVFLRYCVGELYFISYIQNVGVSYLTCFINALTEEVVFRGVILYSLLVYGSWQAVLIQAVMFASSHDMRGGIRWEKVFNFIFLLSYGLLLGAMAIYTGSIVYGIVLHSVVPILNGCLRVTWKYLRGRFNQTNVFYACTCRSIPHLCQGFGGLKIKVTKETQLRLIEEQHQGELGQIFWENYKKNEHLQRGTDELDRLRRANIIIKFPKSRSEVGCLKWKPLKAKLNEVKKA